MSKDQSLRASEEANRIQRHAADPDLSVTLRASAGSGKTRVLVDRIIRLLLVKAPLKSVVALTFTRKAAVEIRQRLRERLGELARLDRAGLEERLHRLLDAKPEPAELDRAALIFEDVLEDSSGLLIGTIHTFCQTLLKRFADEAGLDPAFNVLENTDDLWDEALDDLEAELGREPGDADDLAELAPDPAAARKLLRGIEHERLALDRWCDRVARDADPTSGERLADLLPVLAADLAAHLFDGTLLTDRDDPGYEDLRAAAAAAARVYGTDGMDAVAAVEGDGASAGYLKMVQVRRETMTTLAVTLEEGGDVAGALAEMRTLLFDARQGTVKVGGNVGSKVNREAKREAMAAAAAPVQDLLDLADQVDLYRRNRLWLRFGLRALDRYTALKRRDRCLDFHDLERQAWRLVRDMDVGPWILYRLDARLDHLLVDEFQDTNRNQWEVLQPFAEEFIAGAAEDGRPRSAFFVGDVKQSIYGFRGARPEIFGEVASWLTGRTKEPTLTLPTNFRSLPDVVATVGAVFTAPPLAGLLPDGEAVAAAQIPFRDDGPGRVLITAPVEADPGGDPHEAAAAVAVRMVAHILREGRVREHDVDRPARFGDVLLLARTRTHLAAYESALRRAGVPVVPAGRGALARSREVQDLLLLLRWLVFPADDPALAGVLRSPLFRVPEDVFQSLLAERLDRGGGRGSLWQALRAPEAPDALTATAETLQAWLVRVGRESVHRLLRRIYRDTGAADRFAAALGEQARYNLLRLHDLALDLDRKPFPSLRLFLAEVERAAVREDQEEAVLPDTDQGRVRMMTIHGAKGLEAPFVLLVDHADPMTRGADRLVLDHRHGDAGPLVTGLRKRHGRDDARTAVAVAAGRALTQIRREQANLLYVAMTRARDTLMLVGAAPTHGKDAPSFARWLDEGPRERDEAPAWLDADPDLSSLAPGSGADTAAFRTWTPCGLKQRLDTSSPSDPDAAPPLPSDTRSDHEPSLRLTDAESIDTSRDEPPAADSRLAALAHGVAVHAWLQRAAEAGAVPPGDGAARDEARAVYANPAHDWIFRPARGEAFCEAPVIARLGSNATGVETRVYGLIDRLLLTDEETVVIDYKSNRVAADRLDAVVAHYRPQMEAYRAVLAAARPGRCVRLVLLFTGLTGDEGPGRCVELD